MLTEWVISNFKSISRPIELKLAPLTLLAGINSSGKSTLLQSILLVAQSSSVSARSEPLVLNGPLIKLGQLEDVLHAGMDSDTMLIGFGFLHPKLNSLVFRVESTLQQQIIPQTYAKNGYRSALGLQRTRITFVRYGTQESHSHIELIAGAESRMDRPYFLSESAQGANIELLQQIKEGLYDYTIVGVKERDLLREPYQEWIAGVGRKGIMPNRLLIAYDMDMRQLDEDITWLSNVLPNIRSVSPPREKLSPLIVDVIDRLKGNPEQLEIVRDYVISNMRNLYKDDFIRHLSKNALDGYHLRDLARRLVSAASDYKRERLRGRSIRSRKIGYEVQLFPTEYAQVFDEIQNVLSERIYYLGPLRESPQVLSPIAPFTHRREVGLKGEYTAAVLDEYRNMQIQYCAPPVNGASEMQVYQGTLIEALTIWLNRMDLVDTVDTEEAPRVGYRLTVQDKRLNKPLDLTNVGVGISQVLPTLVLALLAPEGSILLFEQPELHLHPKVQSVVCQ